MRKRGRLTLAGFYPVAQYAGAVLVAVSYARLMPVTWLLPGVYGPRAWMMLWVAALLGLSALMDRAWLRAYRKDLWEQEQGTTGGGLNRSTLLAIGVPCLFLADALAVAHLYLSYFKGGADPAGLLTNGMDGVAMAVGMVLWIYGRSMPKIPFGSVWGIRTTHTLADQRAWGMAHLRAARVMCACGAATLVIATFVPTGVALAAAAVCCAAALAGAFWIAARK